LGFLTGHQIMIKGLLTNLHKFITELLLIKKLKTIIIEEQHQQEIIKFTLKRPSTDVPWGLRVYLITVFVYLQMIEITLLKCNSNCFAKILIDVYLKKT
jgi:hypothetical protein